MRADYLNRTSFECKEGESFFGSLRKVAGIKISAITGCVPFMSGFLNFIALLSPTRPQNPSLNKEYVG